MRTLTTILLTMTLLFSGAASAQRGNQPTENGLFAFVFYYVDVNDGSDANDGKSKSTAFKTITKALSLAKSGEYVWVYAGKYTAASGESFPLVVPSGVSLSSFEGADVTWINASGTNRSVIDLNGASSSTWVVGFTITGGKIVGANPATPAQGAGVTCRNNSFAMLEANVITGNQVNGAPGTMANPTGGEGRGAGIYMDATSGCTARNNTFINNLAFGGAGFTGATGGNGGFVRGAAIFAAGGATILHNTFHHNYSTGGSGGASNASMAGGNGGDATTAGVFVGGNGTVANNFFYDNTAWRGNGGNGVPAGLPGQWGVDNLQADSGTVTHNYYNLSNGPLAQPQYPGSIFGDAFAAKVYGTAGHIRHGSPLRGAAAPAYALTTDLDGVKRPKPATIGAFEPKVRSDANRDGNADIVWRHSSSGDNAVWLMNGTSIAQSAFLAPLGSPWYLAGSGDFNSDGKTDVFFRNSSTGENRLWYLDGLQVTTIANMQAGFTGVGWGVAAVNDFNSDGATDILWRHAFTGTNLIWFMNGASVTAATNLPSFGDSTWSVAGSGDFNGDGNADLFWRNSQTGATRTWLLEGATLLGGNSFPAAAAEWTVGGIGDFYDDGFDDILFRNTVTGENMIWKVALGAGNYQGSAAVLSVPDLNWKMKKVADFNADAKADILWHNPNSGEIAVWLMNGEAVAGAATLPVSLPDAAWKVNP